MKRSVQKRLMLLASDSLGWKGSFVMAFVISVLGSMGFGALNIAAVQLSAMEGWVYALSFSVGCALAEMVFVRFAAPLLIFFSKNKKSKRVFDSLSLFILLVLGFACFFVKENTGQVSAEVLIKPTMPGLLLGISFRLLTPTMVPFWLGWKTVILAQGIRYLALPFALGAGFGTVLMHGFYILAGQFAVDFLGIYLPYLTWLMGVLLLLSAVLQAQRMLKGK